MDRPTAWLAGAGVGLLFVSAAGLLLIVAGVSELRWGLTLPVAFGLGLGGTVAVDYAWVAVVWRRQAAADLAQQNAKTDLVKAQTEVTLLALDGAAGGEDVASDTAPDTAALHRSALKQAVSRFMRGGEQAGSFSIRALSSIVSDGDWAALTDFYCSDGAGRVLRDRGGPLGTAWGHGWTLDAVLQALNADRLPLPPFPEGQVPDVALYVANTTQRKEKRQKAAVVIDHQKG